MFGRGRGRGRARARPRADESTTRSRVGGRVDVGRPPRKIRCARRSRVRAGTDCRRRAAAVSMQGAVSARLPEIQLALDALVFYLSVWRGSPPPGMSLMNLRFRDEGRAGPSDSGVAGPGLSTPQKLGYGLGSVALRYAWARASHAAAGADPDAPGWRGRAWKAMRTLETGYRLAALANLLAFLRTGKYRCAGGRASGSGSARARCARGGVLGREPCSRAPGRRPLPAGHALAHGLVSARPRRAGTRDAGACWSGCCGCGRCMSRPTRRGRCRTST